MTFLSRDDHKSSSEESCYLVVVNFQQQVERIPIWVTSLLNSSSCKCNLLTHDGNQFGWLQSFKRLCDRQRPQFFCFFLHKIRFFFDMIVRPHRAASRRTSGSLRRWSPRDVCAYAHPVIPSLIHKDELTVEWAGLLQPLSNAQGLQT